MWTPDEQEEWLRRIAYTPVGDERATVAHQFADWLESVGRPAHAEVIRLHHIARPRYASAGGDVAFRGSLTPAKRTSRWWRKRPNGYASTELFLPFNDTDMRISQPRYLDDKHTLHEVRFHAKMPSNRQAQLLHRAIRQETG